MTYAYDSASRVTGVRNAKADGTVIAGYVYTRDGVGNPTGVALSDGNLLTFSYDDCYRLTREQRSGTGAFDITYTFDASGNRTTKLASGTTTTFTYNGMDQLTVANAGGVLTSYAFDAAGNNTVVDADGTLTTYTWDLANRMRVAALPSAEVVTLLYDPSGLRRSRQDASGTTAFVWDGQSLLEEHMSGRNVGAGDVSEPKEAFAAPAAKAVGKTS